MFQDHLTLGLTDLGSAKGRQHHLADSWKSTAWFSGCPHLSALAPPPPPGRCQRLSTKQMQRCTLKLLLTAFYHFRRPHTPTRPEDQPADQPVNQPGTGCRKHVTSAVETLPASLRASEAPPTASEAPPTAPRFLRCGQGNVATSAPTCVTETFRSRPRWSVRWSPRCPR